MYTRKRRTLYGIFRVVGTILRKFEFYLASQQNFVRMSLPRILLTIREE
jgi:hypothetical protein